MKLVFGLGNPGKEYEKTRHNTGFMTLDRLADKHGIVINACKDKGMSGKGMIGGEKVVLVKPLTYMNLSGECVRAYVDFYKVDPASDVIVIYDDIDIEPGKLRIRKNGSTGSHNGMKSVIKCLGTEVFARVRVGVGAKPDGWDLADYVLGRPSGEAEKKMSLAMDHAASAIELIIVGRMDEAMNLYNAKKEKPPKDEAKKAKAAPHKAVNAPDMAGTAERHSPEAATTAAVLADDEKKADTPADEADKTDTPEADRT